VSCFMPQLSMEYVLVYGQCKLDPNEIFHFAVVAAHIGSTHFLARLEKMIRAKQKHREFL
jgi:hypothetical protein